MTVAILIITHNDIGQALMKTAASMLAKKSLAVTTLAVPVQLEPKDIGCYADEIQDQIHRLSAQQGVLVLTDICGATPYNLVRCCTRKEDVAVISGLNLPMLLRVLNYAEKPLDELAVIALEGGHKGIRQDI